VNSAFYVLSPTVLLNAVTIKLLTAGRYTLSAPLESKMSSTLYPFTCLYILYVFEQIGDDVDDDDGLPVCPC